MNNSKFDLIVSEHLRLKEVLSEITDLQSKDEAVVFRDRAMRTLWALMDYLEVTSTEGEVSILVLRRLIFALNDLERGARSPILKPSKVINGRAPLTEVHDRRAVVSATVKYLVKSGECKSESQAVKLISIATGIKLGTLKSALIKSVHEANLDVLNPAVISIPPEANINGIFDLIKELFTPKP